MLNTRQQSCQGLPLLPEVDLDAELFPVVVQNLHLVMNVCAALVGKKGVVDDGVALVDDGIHLDFLLHHVSNDNLQSGRK